MPVGGYITKLPFAEGLTHFEKTLAREIVFRSSALPGNLQVRRLMGRCARGAQVVYAGELFITWSPNEEHSALVLRLLRVRSHDPMLAGQENVDEDLRKCSAVNYPSILSASDAAVTIALPL